MIGEELLEHVWLEIMNREASRVVEPVLNYEIISNRETIFSVNDDISNLKGSQREGRIDYIEQGDKEESMDLQEEQTISNKDIPREQLMCNKYKVNVSNNISLDTCSQPKQNRMLVDGEVRKQVDFLNSKENRQ